MGGSSTSTLLWDYLNRLVQDVVSSTTSTYAYDMSNERIKEVVASATSTVTTYYPTKFYNITSGTPTKHVFANGAAIATIIGSGASSTVSSILTDHLTGSNVVTNASGTIVELSDYYPYGATRIDDQTGFNEQRKFAGHEYDAATGLSYMDARYYNGSRGQFLSQDPVFWELAQTRDGKFALLNPQAMNSYSYAGNNPIGNRDPDGRFWWVGFYDWRGYEGLQGVAMKAGEVLGGHDRGLSAVKAYENTIDAVSSKHGVDPNLAKAIVHEEQSHLQLDEILGREQLLPDLGRGGVGLMQVSKDIGSEFGGYSKSELARDPMKNINAGVGYIADISAKNRTTDSSVIGTKYNGAPAYGQRINAQMSDKDYNKNIIQYGIEKSINFLQESIISIKK